MKALVTGGGGFLGLAIVRQLLARGDEVAVLGRHRYPEVEKLGVEVFCGDIRARKYLSQSFAGFDTVFHVAAKAGIWGSYQEYATINVDGTDNVINACHVNDIPVLVHTSTPSVVFHSRDIEGGDESLPYARRYLCSYAATKAQAEAAVLAANSTRLKTCAIRPHLIWGPGDPHLVPRLLARGREGSLRRVGGGKNMVDISYVDNVAYAHILAAENLHSREAVAAGRAYFISQGEPVNLWEWINNLFQEMDIPPVTSQVSFAAAYLVGAAMEAGSYISGRREEPPMTRFVAQQLARSHWFSIERARRDLGYEPRISTAEGMEMLISWLRDQEEY